MKKKLVITTLSLCMILAAAPAQAFAGSNTTGQNADTASLGKYLNSCVASYSNCGSSFLKGCLTSLNSNCSNTNNNNGNCILNGSNSNCTNGSDCDGSDSNCTGNSNGAGNGSNDVNGGTNGFGSWQAQIQDYLDQFMSGANNSGATDVENNAGNNAGNNAQQTPSEDQDNSANDDAITNGGNNSGNAGNVGNVGNPSNSGNIGNNGITNNNGSAGNNGSVNNNAGSSSQVGSYEKQVADIVNQERAAAGLSALKLDAQLSAVTEKKAEDMRDKGYFSHTSPTYGSPFEMMTQFGIKYSAAGENIAKGQKTPSSVMNAWMNSSGHKANILNSNFENIGVGYVTDSNGTTYWVQMFTK